MLPPCRLHALFPMCLNPSRPAGDIFLPLTSFTRCCDVPQEPTLRLLAMHLKYMHWKSDFVEEWKGLVAGVTEFRCLTTFQRAALLHRALHKVCLKRNKLREDDAPWTKTVGKNVTHVSGPLAICLAFCVVRKAPQGFLHLGVGKNRYDFVGLQCRGVGISRLKTWVTLADAISGSGVSAPHTCNQWIEASGKLHAIIHSETPYHIKPKSRRVCVVWLLCVFARLHVRLIGYRLFVMRVATSCFGDSSFIFQ